MYKVIILLFYLCFSLSITHYSRTIDALFTHYSRTIDALFTHNKRTINALFSSFHYGFMLPKSNANIQNNLRISKFLSNFFRIYIPVDTLCCSRHIYLRFSDCVFGCPLIGAPTSFNGVSEKANSFLGCIVSEWGEEKRRQPQRAERVLCCKPVLTRWQSITECFEEHSD